MAYSVQKGLPRGTTSDNTLGDEKFTTTINPKFLRFQEELVSIVLKFFDKKYRNTTSLTGTSIVSDDQELAYELHMPIMR